MNGPFVMHPPFTEEPSKWFLLWIFPETPTEMSSANCCASKEQSMPRKHEDLVSVAYSPKGMPQPGSIVDSISSLSMPRSPNTASRNLVEPQPWFSAIIQYWQCHYTICTPLTIAKDVSLMGRGQSKRDGIHLTEPALFMFSCSQ